MATFKLGRCLINDLIKKKGITQEQLGALVGMSRQQINNYATEDRRMTIEVAINISVALGCSSVLDLYEISPYNPFENNGRGQE